MPVRGEARRPGWAVIASGPSLTAADVAAVEAAGWRTVAVNESFRLISRPDLLYACDYAWWFRRAEEVRPLGFERWCGDRRAAREFGLSFVEVEPGAGLGCGGSIRSCGNSGAQAIQLAFRRGARRILLLGFDHARTGGRAHWHGDHPAGLNNAPETAISGWLAAAPALARDLAAVGVETVNCSRATALDCWPRLALDEALAGRWPVRRAA